MYCYMAFDVQFITVITLSFVMCKLLSSLYVVLDNSTFVTQEFQFKLETDYLYHRGYILPDIKRNWFFADIFTLLVFILVCEQVILLFSLMDMAQWQNTIEQIVTFHESNPDVPRPKILAEVLNTPFTWFNYLLFHGVPFGLGAFIMTGFDRRIVSWFGSQEEGATVVRTVTKLPMLLMAYYLITISSHFIVVCTSGKHLLSMAFTTEEETAEAFTTEEETAENLDLSYSYLNPPMIELQGEPNDMDYE